MAADDHAISLDPARRGLAWTGRQYAINRQRCGYRGYGRQAHARRAAGSARKLCRKYL